jgi:LuxR family transcriptional regulator, maltose regulon positive regulatory protein
LFPRRDTYQVDTGFVGLGRIGGAGEMEMAQGYRPEMAALVPLLNVPRAHQVWVAAAFLLGAMVRDALGDPDAARRALQHALDLAEPDQLLVPLGRRLAPDLPGRHLEDLTQGEIRVLHYLPTNLTAREIARELHLSVNTIKTHLRHLYAKLGARTRTQAVEQARALALLPSCRPPGRAEA